MNSIYDHTIFEAISKVVQKLIPQLPALESLMSSLNYVSTFEEFFFFSYFMAAGLYYIASFVNATISKKKKKKEHYIKKLY